MDYSSDPTSHIFHTVKLKECQATSEYSQFVKNFYAFANIQKACLSRLSSSLVLRDVRPGEGFVTKQKAFFLKWCKRRGLTPDPGDIIKLESKEKTTDPLIITRQDNGSLQNDQRLDLQRHGEHVLERDLPVPPAPISHANNCNHDNSEPSDLGNDRLRINSSPVITSNPSAAHGDSLLSVSAIQDDPVSGGSITCLRSERGNSIPIKQSQEPAAIPPRGSGISSALVPASATTSDVQPASKIYTDSSNATHSTRSLTVEYFGFVKNPSPRKEERTRPLVPPPNGDCSHSALWASYQVFLSWDYLFNQLLAPPW